MEYNTRILIVDDNESIHEDFRKVLIRQKSEAHRELDALESELFGEGETAGESDDEVADYELDSAFQGQQALEMVQRAAADGRPYALCFMDVRMPPGWDGIETICRIWKDHPFTEMVLCTAYSDYTWDDIIDRLGSTDKLLFLRKPFDAVAVQQMALSLVKKWNLGAQARYYVEHLEKEVEQRTEQLRGLLRELEKQNTRLSESNERLKHTALHDPLTGLPNRLLFHDRLQHAIELAARKQQNFALAIMDLDGFKEINDRRGHLAGDQVLKTVASRLRGVLRASDTVARMGGDEFAFVLPEAGEESPEQVARKMLATLDEPIGLDDGELQLGASIGLATYPGCGTDMDTLMSLADRAMYEAKRGGLGIAVHRPGDA